MLKEFKEFAVKGNMIDMSVGIIIGSAFTALVKSVVDDIFTPVLSIFTGKLDFSELFIALDGNEYANLQAARDAGASVLAYGNFITGVINFIIMAFVVFLFVKGINKLRRTQEEAPVEVLTKICPYCKSEIHKDAVKCPHCLSALDDVSAVQAEEL